MVNRDGVGTELRTQVELRNQLFRLSKRFSIVSLYDPVLIIEI
jgi:hypothetical protein